MVFPHRAISVNCISASNFSIGVLRPRLPLSIISILEDLGDQQGMAEAMTRVLSTNLNRERITQHAGRFSWGNTSAAYLEVLESALG